MKRVTPMHLQESRAGLLYGIGAYGFWGIVPLYFRALKDVCPEELLAHRIVWSTVLLAGLLSAMRRWGEFRRCLRSPRTRWTLALTTVLIAANWYCYIWAATHEQLVQASLGYFIAPLASAALGMLVLHERLRRAQQIALALAAAGVLILSAQSGQVPWIALALAGTFSLYGLLRKTVAADALTGLAAESLLLTPLAAGYLALTLIEGRAAFGSVSRSIDLLLLAASVVTVFPLYCFAQAARRLRLTTIGFLQYLSPTGQLLLAVLFLGEPFQVEKLYGFVPIWLALALYSYDAMTTYRRPPAAKSF
jgi:chloramphenicol-sensitive protein RarD